jgi:hypothetical protein
MSRTLVILNVLLLGLFTWGIFSIARATHQVPTNMLLGFIPSVATFVALRNSGNRLVGGLACLANGLFTVGGLLVFSIMAIFGAMEGSRLSEQVSFYVFGLLWVVTGVFNFRSVWSAFGTREKGS